MKNSSIKLNALLNVIYTIVNMVFPLITYPYVTRVLSATGMGKVSFFTAVSNYAVMVGSLGISTYGIRAVAKVRDDKEELSKVTTELLLLNTIITAIVIGALVVASPFINEFNSEPVLLLINLLIVAATPFGLNWLYSGLEQYAYITKRTILFKTISLAAVFLFVRQKGDYPIYAAITAFSTIGAYICNLLYARKFVAFHSLRGLEYKKHFKPMLLLFASILAVSVYTNLDTIMLGFINDNFQVGLYSVASKVKWLLLSAVNAVSAVLLPRLSNYISHGEKQKYAEALKKSVSFIFLITIPLATYFTLEAKDSIYFLGGSEYSGAILCMQFLMPILVISGFSNVTGNQVLIPQGCDSQFMIAVVVGAVVDIILNAVLMPGLACTGAAIATLAAEFTQMSIQLHFARKDIFKNIHKSTLWKSILAAVIAGLATVGLRTFVNIFSIVNLMITAVAFFGIYVTVLVAMREEYMIEIMERLLSKM